MVQDFWLSLQNVLIESGKDERKEEQRGMDLKGVVFFFKH